jgi:hypothetical protein
LQKLTWFAETLHETAGAGRSSCLQLPSCSLFFLFLFFLFLFLTFYLSRLFRFFFFWILSLSLVLSSVLCSLVFFFVLVFPRFCPFPYSVSLFFRGLSLSVPCSSFSPVFNSVFFVRVCSSLLFSPCYPLFLLLLRGLSLAFIKPEDAMRSPRQ